MGSWPAAVVVVASLALSGCVSTVHEPQADPASPEVLAAQQQQSDVVWGSLGLPDDKRPPNPAIEVVSPEEWPVKFVACTKAAGFDNYSEIEGGGYQRSGPEAPTEAESLAMFSCSVTYLGDYGPMTAAQFDYWYDYFKQELVPCLTVHGFEPTVVPSRKQFRESLGAWNPYWTLLEREQARAFADDRLHEVCPATPQGARDLNYFG